MKKLFLVLTVVLCSTFTISACGQKGPLYLPGNPSEVQTQVPNQNAPQDESDEESDNDKSN